jgi:hypothetical protein
MRSTISLHLLIPFSVCLQYPFLPNLYISISNSGKKYIPFFGLSPDLVSRGNTSCVRA